MSLTKPISQPIITRRGAPGRTELRHGMRRRAQSPEPEAIVRIPLGFRGRLYAYRCRGAALGSIVEVDSPISGTVQSIVVALGRGGYKGPLKRAVMLPLDEMDEGFCFTPGATELADDTVPGNVAKALLTMLGMLECANVETLPAHDPPLKGHIAHGVPHFDVLVRQPNHRREPPEEMRPVDWSHRWETAAHFKYFARGPIFDNASPDRRVMRPDGSECVRIWCPSFIKGPAHKPFIPKVHIVGGAK